MFGLKRSKGTGMEKTKSYIMQYLKTDNLRRTVTSTCTH